MRYNFDEDVAKEVGVEEAMMLSNIEWWVEKNAANNKHYYEDHYWSYNSQEAFQKLFAFWSRRQVQRILKKLVDRKYLKSGNFNKRGYDKTLWYTSMRPEFLKKIEKITQTLIAPNGAIDSTKRVHGEHQTVLPIPDNKPDTKTTVNRYENPPESQQGNTVNRSNNPIEALPTLDQDEREQHATAAYILDGLGAKEHKSKKFFLLVASRIPRKIIETHLSGILYDGAKNPGALFTYRMTKHARETLEQRAHSNQKETLHSLTKNLADSLKTPYQHF